jgi:hypothetical protein
MAHFALLDSSNTVIFVTVGRDEDNEVDISRRTGQTYKKTSYNTRGGIYYGTNGQPDDGTPFRGNYAGIGYIYDSKNDVFYSPQPFPSWKISAPTWLWTAPVPYPKNGKTYKWDESNQQWIEVVVEGQTPVQSVI